MLTFTLKTIATWEDFVVVQWFRLHFPLQGMWIQSLIRELRSHMPCS